MAKFLKRLRNRLTGAGATLGRIDELQAALAASTADQQRAIQDLDARLVAQSHQLHAILAHLEEKEAERRQRSVAVAISSRPVTAPVRVTFFFQVPDTWPIWATVWEIMSQDSRVDAKIVCMPFIHDEDGVEARMRSFLAERDLPFVHHSAYDLEADAPDVVFFQNPYDSTRPEEYAAHRLAALGIRLAYIPYCLDMVGGPDNLRWQYDLDLQRLAWRIFARSPRHGRMFAKYCRAGNAHVVVTGHPKYDRFAQGVLAARTGPIAEALGGRRAVLWTPHFSIEEGGWSTYLQYGETILSAFEARSDLALIIRPHPLFFPRLRKVGVLDEAGERAFRERLKASGMILDESGDYAEAFACSEALMADAGSFLLEYLPTEKPILYLDQPLGPGLNDEGSVVQGYYQVNGEADVRDFIDMVARGEDPLKDRRLAQIKEFIPFIDGHAGRRIAEHVIENVCAERRLTLEHA